jgi:hypothetical protein
MRLPWADLLPLADLYFKGRLSKRIGFVHFIHVDDWINVCHTLHTPLEISDYLRYRAEVGLQLRTSHSVPEKALVGKYLSNTGVTGLRHEDEMFVDTFVNDPNEFSLANLLQCYFDRLVSGNRGAEYHAILTQLAKLKRNTMKELRKRILWGMEKCKEEIFALPSRFYSSTVNCSYIVVPITRKDRDKWQQRLQNYTQLSMYDFRSPCGIGISIAPDDETSFYLVNWCYLENVWEPDPELDKLIADVQPFRQCRVASLDMYKFS